MKNFKFIIVFVILIITKCGREKAEPICFYPDQVSFANDIQPIFNQYCANSNCHGGSNPQAGLNLEASVSYMELFTPGKGYIDTLNPKYSLLYSQITNKTSPMPPDGNMSPCLTRMILKWIEQKAKNN
jgi:hypothetical protein